MFGLTYFFYWTMKFKTSLFLIIVRKENWSYRIIFVNRGRLIFSQQYQTNTHRQTDIYNKLSQDSLENAPFVFNMVGQAWIPSIIRFPLATMYRKHSINHNDQSAITIFISVNLIYSKYTTLFIIIHLIAYGTRASPSLSSSVSSKGPSLGQVIGRFRVPEIALTVESSLGRSYTVDIIMF